MDITVLIFESFYYQLNNRKLPLRVVYLGNFTFLQYCQKGAGGRLFTQVFPARDNDS